MTGGDKLLKDPAKVKRQAEAIIRAKGVTAEELTILAGHMFNEITQGMVVSAYAGWANGDKEYRRDYVKVLKAAQATGLPPERGNACAMALAARLLQEASIDFPDAAGGRAA